MLKLHSDKNSLDDLASATDKKIETASAVTQENKVLAGAGTEPYVIGAAFALELNKPSALIKGNTAIYMIEVISKEIAEEIESYRAYANSLQNQENRSKNNRFCLQKCLQNPPKMTPEIFKKLKNFDRDFD